MANQHSNAVKEPENGPNQAQKSLENWCRNVGADQALAPGWEKGAAGCLGQKLAEILLKKVKEIYAKSRHSPGRQHHVWDLIHSEKAAEHVALESLLYVLGNMDEERSFNQLATVIGKRAEYVLWLTHPSWGRSQHLKGLRLASNNDLGMDLMLKRLRDRGFRKAAAYRPLTHVERAALGAVFIECIEMSTRMIETYIEVRPMRKRRMVRYTSTYWDFLGRWKDGLKVFRPLFMPMVTEPRPWTGHNDGGYLTIDTTVSTVNWARWPEVSRKMHDCVLGSINLLQSQRHQLDHGQMALAHAVWNLGHGIGSLPPRDRLKQPDDNWYREQGLGPSAYWKAVWQWKSDRRRDSARSRFVNAVIAYGRIQEADTLHWVWNMDHRGRLYSKAAQINMQGPDHLRTLIQFKERSPIKGHEAQFAWSVGDAYGIEPDWDKRKRFLKEASGLIGLIGGDPLAHMGHWAEAKESWRFVQLCRDWHGYLKDPGYTSGTMHWFDQTCSGWGHVACLTGDALLAQYTNVTGSMPADLYMGLGRLIESRIKSASEQPHDNERDLKCLLWWREHQIPRSLWKKALMPVIYGRSYRSLADVISLYLRDEISDFITDQGLRIIDLARCLATVTNNVTKEALPHVRGLAKWLAQISNMQIDAGQRPYWFTPNGMAVECYQSETHVDTIDLQLARRTITVALRDNTGGKPDKRRTARKLVPDYIHSMDGAYLQRFVSHWGTYQHPISTVHDCFGTTLEHAATLRKELHDQWHRFYSVDYLSRHQGMVQMVLGVDVPAPPLVGTLDRSKVGENVALFS
jgi:DNA-directed RNA polymerase